MRNTCVQCNDNWNVNLRYAKLDQIDNENISNFGQLFSLCEDCNEGECVSIERAGE